MWTLRDLGMGEGKLCFGFFEKEKEKKIFKNIKIKHFLFSCDFSEMYYL